MNKISIVFPAYNEEENVGIAITRAQEILPLLFNDYEIILVDDGSVDKTWEVANEFARKDSRIRILCHEENRGYGAALKTGLFSAKHEYVFYTDADNQFNISELDGFLPLMKFCDVAVGYRIKRNDSTIRIFLSWGYNWLVFILFRIRIKDIDCSFKLFRKEVLDSITIECNDFFVDTEIIARVVKAGFRITERGVHHYPRKFGKTTVQASHIHRTLKTVIKMWKNIYLNK